RLLRPERCRRRDARRERASSSHFCEAASFFTGHNVELGLDNVGIVLLTLTLLISMINASAGRTNILQGVVHLPLFAAFLAVIVGFHRVVEPFERRTG
ncbi:MAG: hypothetical protein JSU89_03785, partial [Myxococcales bacterium]